MKKFGSRHISVVWVLMAQALWAVPGNAAGALAVGVAPGGAQQGFAYGVTRDQATDAIAGEHALAACKSAKDDKAWLPDVATLMAPN